MRRLLGYAGRRCLRIRPTPGAVSAAAPGGRRRRRRRWSTLGPSPCWRRAAA